MAKKRLLTEAEHSQFFRPKLDPSSLSETCVLSNSDLAYLDTRRRDWNVLGSAIHIALLRHSGFSWQSDESPPAELIEFLSIQLGISASQLDHYARCSQTFSDHAAQAMGHLGVKPFTSRNRAWLRNVAAEAAADTDAGPPIVMAMLAALRLARIAFPTPTMIERLGLVGRAQARRQAADELVAELAPDMVERLEKRQRSRGSGVSLKRPAPPI